MEMSPGSSRLLLEFTPHDGSKSRYAVVSNRSAIFENFRLNAVVHTTLMNTREPRIDQVVPGQRLLWNSRCPFIPAVL